MKPNIFNISTKELTQDGFITWLLLWADNSNLQYDNELCKTAKYFVKQLLSKQIDVKNIEIETVKVSRQWNNIDILAEVNNKYVIIIEDKTNTGEHSEQLERYKEIAELHYSKKKELVFIYLKTGNESILNYQKIREKGFDIFDRKDFLQVLNSNNQIKNEIFLDFKVRLNQIEEETNSFEVFENLNENWYAAEGFYLKIQEFNSKRHNYPQNIVEWDYIGDWRYVANQAGGFLGFWYYWTWTKYGAVYIQIENRIENDFKVIFKVGDWDQDIKVLYELFNILTEISKNYGVSIYKPDKFRVGVSSTLAIIDNALSIDEKTGKIKIDMFFETLVKLENILNDFEQKYKDE